MLVKKIKFEIRDLLGSFSKLISFLAKKSSWEHVAVRADSVLCVEGFPRSANTFAVAALTVSNPELGHIARHSHLSGQVKKAVELGVPTLLLVREPLGAVISMKQWERDLELEQLLNSYIRFHRSIIGISESLIVIDFKEVTSDFGRVVEKLNERSALGLKPVEHDDNFESAVFTEVERMAEDYYERVGLPKDELHDRVGRPEKRRASEKEILKKELLENKKLNALLEVANQLYKQLTNGPELN